MDLTTRIGLRLRRSLIAVLCAAMCAAAPARADSERILIVLSGRSDPYIQAANECEASLSERGIEWEQVMLDDLDAKRIAATSGRVISIGARASATLALDLPPRAELYYCMTPGPEQIGLTEREHTSGISVETSSMKQMALIKDSRIKRGRIGVLYSSGSEYSQRAIKEMEDAIPKDCQLVKIDLDAHASPSDGIKALLDSDVDLVWTIADPAVYNGSIVKALLLDSLRQRIPVFGFSQSLVKAGAVFGFGIEPATQGKRVAQLAAENASDEHLDADPELAINEIVAERIRIRFPESFVGAASRVFK